MSDRMEAAFKAAAALGRKMGEANALYKGQFFSKVSMFREDRPGSQWAKREVSFEGIERNIKGFGLYCLAIHEISHTKTAGLIALWSEGIFTPDNKPFYFSNFKKVRISRLSAVKAIITRKGMVRKHSLNHHGVAGTLQ